MKYGENCRIDSEVGGICRRTQTFLAQMSRSPFKGSCGQQRWIKWVSRWKHGRVLGFLVDSWGAGNPAKRIIASAGVHGNSDTCNPCFSPLQIILQGSSGPNAGWRKSTSRDAVSALILPKQRKPSFRTPAD